MALAVCHPWLELVSIMPLSWYWGRGGTEGWLEVDLDSLEIDQPAKHCLAIDFPCFHPAQSFVWLSHAVEVNRHLHRTTMPFWLDGGNQRTWHYSEPQTGLFV